MKKVLHALQSLEKWIIVIAFVIMVVAIFLPGGQPQYL